jgi:hypothetical protein
MSLDLRLVSLARVSALSAALVIAGAAASYADGTVGDPAIDLPSVTPVASPAPQRQVQAPATSAALKLARQDGAKTAGDIPQLTHLPTGASNEPNWTGVEYTSH